MKFYQMKLCRSVICYDDDDDNDDDDDDDDDDDGNIQEINGNNGNELFLRQKDSRKVKKTFEKRKSKTIIFIANTSLYLTEKIKGGKSCDNQLIST